ncbi:hypothetical protein ACPXCE_20930 [Streptomyces sp. DT24]|uniref:hypothetical protein n=1 Tax=Streptomyces sp. DT24 TaxID=3416520 RepID=UPI003CE73A35
MPGDTKAAKAGRQQMKALAGGLWFPLFFFVGFMLCYLLPFHAPQPHDVKVAVSTPAAAAQLRAGLDQRAPGGYDIVPAADPAAARQSVLDQDAVAAFTLDGGKATLYEAKANGAAMESVLSATFTPVAAQAGADLDTVELVPTAAGDGTGTGLFYLAMAWNIVPYITVMMLLRVVTIGRRGKLLTFAGLGAFVSVAGFAVARALDVVPNEPLAMVYAFLLTQAVAWVTYGLVPFVRQFIPGVAMGLFVLLSIPSSGGAIPHQLVPGFFRALHPVMPLGNLVDALRGIFYFDGTGLLKPTLVLLAWLAAGAGLIGVGVVGERKAERAAAGSAEEEIVEDPAIEAPRETNASGGPSPVLTGLAADEHGSPVADALVTVMDADSHRLALVHTDETGLYEAVLLGTRPVPGESVTVLLSARDRAPVAARLHPRPGETVRKDFVLTSALAEAVPAAGVPAL